MPIPVPKAGFVERLERVARTGSTRWRSEDKRRLYEWDHLHGHFEVYDRRGNHLGVADAATGEIIGDAVAGRTIDV